MGRSPQPIFWAIRVASAQYVQLLIDHSADPAAEEAVAVEEVAVEEHMVDHGGPGLKRRTPIEAAAQLLASCTFSVILSHTKDLGGWKATTL